MYSDAIWCQTTIGRGRKYTRKMVSLSFSISEKFELPGLSSRPNHTHFPLYFDVNKVVVTLQFHLRRYRIGIKRRDLFARVQQSGETVDNYISFCTEMAFPLRRLGPSHCLAEQWVQRPPRLRDTGRGALTNAIDERDQVVP